MNEKTAADFLELVITRDLPQSLKALIKIKDDCIASLKLFGLSLYNNGKRSKPPPQQAELDLFALIIERRYHGIIICGAEPSKTGASSPRLSSMPIPFMR
jgi:hypothetical protein